MSYSAFCSRSRRMDRAPVRADVLRTHGIDALRSQFRIEATAAPEPQPPAEMIGRHPLRDGSLALGVALWRSAMPRPTRWWSWLASPQRMARGRFVPRLTAR